MYFEPPPLPPKSIRVLHLDFKLEFVELRTADAAKSFAWCDKPEQIISVTKSLSPKLMADCMIHELFHAMHFAVGCEETLSEEQICKQFAGPWVALIRDNPQLFVWLSYLCK